MAVTKSRFLTFTGTILSDGPTYNTPFDSTLAAVVNTAPSTRRYITHQAGGLDYIWLDVWIGRATSAAPSSPHEWTYGTINVAVPGGFGAWIGQTVTITVTMPNSRVGMYSLTATLNGASVSATASLNPWGVTTARVSGEPAAVFMPDWTPGSPFSFPGASNPTLIAGSVSNSADVTQTIKAGFGLFANATPSVDISLSATPKLTKGISLQSYSASIDVPPVVYTASGPVRASSTATVDSTLAASSRVQPGSIVTLSNTFNQTATAGNLIRASFGQRFVDEDYLVPDYFYPDSNPPASDVSLLAVAGVTYVYTTATDSLNLFDTDISLSADVTQIRPGDAAFDTTVELSCQANVIIDASPSLTYDTTASTFAANLIDFGTAGYTEDDYVDPEYFEGFNIRIVLASEFTTEIAASSELITSSEMFVEASLAAVSGYQINITEVLEATAAFDSIGGNGPGVLISSPEAAIQAQLDLTEAVSNLISAEANLQAFNDVTLITGRIHGAQAELSATFTIDTTTEYQVGIIINLTVDVTATPLVGYGVYASAILDSSNITLINGKIVALDDYYIVVVPPETRVINTSNEPRYLLVKPETRITTTPLENRGQLVNPETRTYKITANKATQIGRRTRRIEQ